MSFTWAHSFRATTRCDSTERLLFIFGFKMLVIQNAKSRDSSVGIALGYGMDDRGCRVRFPAGAGNLSLQHRVQNGSGAHPASYPMGTRTLSLGVKRQGREADHSPPSSIEWSYTFIRPIHLHGVVLKPRVVQNNHT
jgi:hypothetical protein